MHDRTLLYGALTVTAAAAVFGIYKSRAPRQGEITITPVSVIDATRTVSSAEVPIRLTSSDGTGLKLQAMRANAVVEDPLALTELHLTFENPENRTLEGTFRITLPQGASLSRFAMKVNGAWQEGEVVEKQAARRAYEDFLHRKQDPALMEQGAGNEFTARVFPIPARGTKEIIIAYSETLEAGSPYVLPLSGLPMLGTLDVDVHAAGARAGENGQSNASFSLHQQKFTPASDFVVPGKQLPRSAGLRSGELAIARIVPFASSRPEPVSSAIVLVDTSASRGLGLADQARLVQKTLAKLPPDARITVACFDQEVVQVYEGKAGGFGDTEVSAITARGALGASDFEAALAWAGEEGKKTKTKRVIIVGDGVATAGETDGQKLKTKVEKLRDAGIERIDAVAVGGIRDDGFLRTVVRGVLDRDGVVLDAKLGPDALARRLSEATTSGVPVTVEGARWSWPRTLDGLQAGDEVMVYAELDAGKPVRVSVGAQPQAPDLRTIDRPLIERAWAKAKIDSLIEAPTEDPVSTKQQIIALSTRHRVVSAHTAMLVLETDNDYARFGIDRNATVDILSVQSGRVAVVHSPRAWEQKLAQVEQEARKQQTADGTRAKGRAERADTDSPTATATAAPSPRPAAAAPASPPAGPTSREEARQLAQQFGTIGNVRDQNAAPAEARADVPAMDSAPQGAVESAAGPGLALSGIGEGGGGRGNRGGSPTQPMASAAPAPEPPPPPPTTSLDLNMRGDGRASGAAPSVTYRPALRVPAPTAARRGHNEQGETDRERTTTPTRSGTVRASALLVERGISDGEVQRVVRAAIPQLRACYNAALQNAPFAGHIDVAVTIDALGEVKTAEVTGTRPAALGACVSSRFKAMRFPAPGSGDARFRAGFDFVPDQGSATADPVANASAPNAPKALPYEGRFRTVMEHLSRGAKDAALDEARHWQTDQPGDVLALVALGEVHEARGDLKTAARAYGSILELFSFRADSRRFAGERLERLKDPGALRLAVDSYGKAVEQRPDHPASHRLYAFTLLKQGEHEKAFEAMKVGAARSYPSGRFRGVDRILKEDLGLIAAAWAKAAPARAAEIHTKLVAAGGSEEATPSLRFVLNWETDANDVDFHIHDGRGGHAYYSTPTLPSDGSLYADVTTGYGPECFTIRGARAQRAYPYTLQAHYYSRGPMGYGMGKLEIVEHDGHGNLTFEERPFVVMVDRAYVDLGTVESTTTKVAAIK